MSQKLNFHFRENLEQWLSAGLILLTVGVTFGVSIGKLGLYDDQWASVLYPFSKPTGFILETDIKSLLITLFGPNVILYQLLNLILLTLDGVLFYRLLFKMGIQATRALTASLLFVVFPAFSQPAAAFDLSPILFGLLFSFLSIFNYIYSLEKIHPDYKLAGIGIVFAGLAMASSVIVCVFVGLIVPILFLFYCVLNKKFPVLPGVGAAVHLVASLTVLYLQFPSIKTPDLSLLTLIVKNWLYSFILTWRQIISMPAGGREIAIYLLVLGVAAGILVLIFTFLNKFETSDISKDRLLPENDLWLLLGAGFSGFVFFFLLAIFQIPIGTEYPVDLGMIVIGTATGVLMTSIVRFLFLEEFQSVILAVLIVLSAGYRFQTTSRFVTETGKVESFIGQLQTRADTIHSGTSMVVEQLPFDFTSNRAVESLIRDRFALTKENGSFQLIRAEDLAVREFLQNPAQKSTELRIENTSWEISKDRLLAVWIPAGECVEVIDSSTDLEKLPAGLSLAGTFSNSELLEITNMSDVKQQNQFRTTISDDWCFYFQLANRYMQISKWDEVIQIYDEAEKEHLLHEKYQDYPPLLAAYIHKNKLSDAVDLSKRINKNPESQNSICKQWTKILSDETFPKEVIREAGEAKKTVGCEE